MGTQVSVTLSDMDQLTSRLNGASIGERVLKLRKARGIDQETLADRSDMSTAYVSRLERGTVPNPKVMDLDKIATGLGIPLSVLVSETDDPGALVFTADLESIRAELTEFPPNVANSLMSSLRRSVEVVREAMKSEQN